MILKKFIKRTIGLLLWLIPFFYGEAQVTLSTDFTNDNDKKTTLQNIWTVVNRISPENGVNVRKGLDVNTIRMIGGINRKVNGESVQYPEYDVCRYDSITNKYIYNWAPLKSRIDAVLKSGVRIFQLVLDQPPWAFQYGYTFIPEGTCDSIHFREDERVTIYGNSLPPCDKKAYFEFIQTMMKELIAIYSRSVVESWRFRVGSEIETPDHWKGSKLDFIEHFANTEKAVRSVLPNAKVGVHTRDPRFLYKKGAVLNYKGEPIASFANDLIEYCYNNNIKYDFWGISDYVIVAGNSGIDFSKKYTTYFADLVNNPKWNSKASIDVMEYAAIVSMGTPDNSSAYLSCGTSHAELINIGYSHLFYRNIDKRFDHIFRWGARSGSMDGVGIDAINSMVGKIRYETNVAGSPIISGNQLDAIYSKSPTGHQYDVLLYSVNDKSPNYTNDEPVTLSFASDLPAGTKVFYRHSTYGKDQNKFQNFMLNEPASGWVKTYLKTKVQTRWDNLGDAAILNPVGDAEWSKYENPHPYLYSDWCRIVTVARNDGGSGSMITVNTQIPSFAFKKFEFVIHLEELNKKQESF